MLKLPAHACCWSATVNAWVLRALRRCRRAYVVGVVDVVIVDVAVVDVAVVDVFVVVVVVFVVAAT